MELAEQDPVYAAGHTQPDPKNYPHKPLKFSASIRLLELLPSREKDAPIRCQVREFALTDEPHTYEALSYVWGSATDSRIIFLDHGPIQVTVNCWLALRSLRHKYRKRELWVDAICIDQRDTPDAIRERSGQIKLMGMVYHQAKRVIIWLGPGGDSTSWTWAAAEILAFSRVFGIKALDKVLKRVFWPGDSTLPPSKHYGEVLEMLENPWFSRVWTIQEMGLARKRVVQRGNITRSWLRFDIVTAALTVEFGVTSGLSNRRQLAVLFHILQPSEWLSFRLKLLNLLGHPSIVNKGLDKGRELEFLLSLMAQKSTKPIDKVYSVYPILKLMGIEMPEPDYNKSALQAYEEATRSWIRSRRDLTILFLAVRPRNYDEGPSWVPDWAGDETPHSIYIDLIGSKFLLQGISPPNEFFASKQSKTGRKSLETTTQLTVLGKSLGRISWCQVFVTAETCQNEDELLSLVPKAAEAIRDWCVKVHQSGPYSNGNHPVDIVYDGLVAFGSTESGAIRSLESGGPSERATSTASRESFHTFYEIARRSNYENGSPEYEEFDMVLEEGLTGEFIMWFTMAANYAFFALSSGYKGVAWHNVRDGDEVFLLAGSPCPMVLRKHENGYRFVVGAYVHGVMYGEAWPENEDELIDITLV